MKDNPMSSSDKNGAAVEISAADNNEDKVMSRRYVAHTRRTP